MPDDAAWATLARQLAEALADEAYTRKEDDKKRVAQLNTELCAMRRAELAEQQTVPSEPQ